MGAVKEFSKDAFIYGLGRGLTKFIGFFLLPFYTRTLTPSDYGILDTLGTGVFFLMAILNMGLDSASGRYFYMAKSDEEKGKVLFTVLVLRFVTMIPSIILSLFSEQISIFLFKTPDYTWVVFFSCMYLPVQLLVSEQEHLYRYFREPWKFNIITTIKMLTGIAFGITLVVVLKKGVLGAQIANFSSSLILFFFSFLVFTKKKYTYRFSWHWAKRMLKFGFPLIWAGIAAWVYISSDRLFLLHYQNTAAIGLYSVGSKLAQPIALLNMAVQMSAGPLFMSWYESENAPDKPKTKKSFTKIWYLYLTISVTLSLLISIFSKDIVKIMTTSAYVMGALVIPFLLFSQILSQSLQLTAVGMSLKEKTGHFAWLITVTALINVGLNFYFVPKYSFVGAAFTTLIANFAYFMMAYFVSQKLFYIRRKLLNILIYIVIGFIIALFFPFAQLKFDMIIPLWFKFIAFLFSLTLPFVFGIMKIETLRNVLIEIKTKIIR